MDQQSIWRLGLLGALLGAAGCGGDARLELSAADVLSVAADRVELALHEYHVEVSQHDDTREQAVVSAFIERVKRDPADAAALDQHAVAFQEALAGIRADRETEFSRRQAALDHVAVLREVAGGLRKLAVDSLNLQDEVRRYLNDWIAARQQAGSAATVQGVQP